MPVGGERVNNSDEIFSGHFRIELVAHKMPVQKISVGDV